MAYFVGQFQWLTTIRRAYPQPAAASLPPPPPHPPSSTMVKAKKTNERAASPSMASKDPERDDDVRHLEHEDDSPPSKKLSVRKKRKDASDPEAQGSGKSSKPTKKRVKKVHESPPVADDDDDDDDGDVPEEDNDDDDAPVPDIDPEIIDQAFSQYRKLHRKLPSAEELAEALECDYNVATLLIKKKKRAIEKLTNERRAKKVNGYYKMAIAAGYGDFKKPTRADAEKDTFSFYSNASAQGFDSHKPILSMSDMLRCAKCVPAQPAQASFGEQEFAMRCELLTTSLPADGARELLANADAIFKEIINRSVGVAMQRCGAQMVKPSHGITVLKPIADNMLFSSINAPPGLVAYGVAAGVLPAEVGDARKKRDAAASKANAKLHART